MVKRTAFSVHMYLRDWTLNYYKELQANCTCLSKCNLDDWGEKRILLEQIFQISVYPFPPCL